MRPLAHLTGRGRVLLRCARAAERPSALALISGWVRVAVVTVAVVAVAGRAGRVRAGLVRVGGCGAVRGN